MGMKSTRSPQSGSNSDDWESDEWESESSCSDGDSEGEEGELEEEKGQDLNLSWPGGQCPSKISWPF